MKEIYRFWTVLTLVFTLGILGVKADEWVVYEGQSGPGKGKHVVLISGDEEYRSEEALPQLGKILAHHHGFKCTVLFAIGKDGIIDPNNQNNIPGLEALKTADLMVIATRFRNLPDDQMAHIDDYLKTGKPVLGLRTATHAFSIGGDRKYAHYGNNYNGERKLWKGGFGRLVLGEKWISHHGGHKSEATRGIPAPGKKNHPLLRGCEDIFGLTDVYGVRLPLPGDSEPLVLGQVLKGMKPTDEPVEGRKNDPIMPVAWIKSYQVEDGKKGRVFCTTMGASIDMESEGMRRLLINAAYWCVGLEDQIPERAKVEVVGKFEPSMYGFKPKTGYWDKKNLRPEDFK